MDDLQDNLDKAQALLILKESEGGEILLNGLKSDLNGLANALMREYSKATHTELIALISQYKAKYELIQTIERSEQQVRILKEEYVDKK